MALRPPSLSKEYDAFFSGDPALIQPPDAPSADATDEVKAAHADAVKAYDAKLRVARETGDWRQLVIPGESPTIFKMRPIVGELYRDVFDRFGSAKLGPGRFNAQLFRCAVRGVSNLKDETGSEVEVNLVPNPVADLREFGTIAHTDIVSYLDGLSPLIVTELGSVVLERASRIAPKS